MSEPSEPYLIYNPENEGYEYFYPEPEHLFVETQNDGLHTADIFYVSPQGDDSNSGSMDSPWLTIQHAVDSVSAGQKIYVREGVYSEIVWIEQSGVEDSPIILSAYPNEEVILDGSSFPRDENNEFWGMINATYQDHLVIRGFKIRNAHRAAIVMDNASHITIEDNLTYNTLGSGIITYWGDDIKVYRNEIILACNANMYRYYSNETLPTRIPCIQECLTVAGADGFEVAYNKVHHNGNPIQDGGEGIDLKHGSVNGSAHHNQVYDCNKLGFYVDSYAPTYNIDVYSNLVARCGDWGMSVSAESGDLVSNIRVFNNIIYDNKHVGLGVEGAPEWGPAQTHPIEDIYIYNNTIFHNGERDERTEPWGVGIHINAPDGDNIQIYNNLLAFNRTEQIMVNSNGRPENLFIDNNLQYKPYMGPNEEYGQVKTIIEDPQFSNLIEEDGRIEATSPVINVGDVSRRVPDMDYYGKLRDDGIIDVGAIEF